MTLATLAADVDALLADLGVAVSYGSSPVQTTNGIFREISVTIVDEAMTQVQEEKTLRIRTGTLTGLLPDQPITIGGNSYTTRKIGPPLLDGTTVIGVV